MKLTLNWSENMADETDDISQDLGAAWEAAEAAQAAEAGQDDDAAELDTAGQPVVELAGGEPEQEQPEPGSQDQPAGDFPAGGDGAQAEADPNAGPAAAQDDGPPKGLSPAAREAWKDTPKAIQEDIRKREADFEAGIQRYAEDAKRVQQMDTVLQPYQQLFALNGGPQNTLPGVLQTAAILQMGSEQQKAQTIYNLMTQFNVPVQAVDDLLVGKQVNPQVRQNDQLNQMLDQRLAPLTNFVNQFQQAQQTQDQQAQQAAQQALAEFAKTHEFYEDVKGDMADLIEMASRRGQALSNEDAYNKAVQLHPQISQILTARQSQESVQRKKLAAKPLHGGQTGEPGTAPTDSRTADIENAWDMVADAGG